MTSQRADRCSYIVGSSRKLAPAEVSAAGILCDREEPRAMRFWGHVFNVSIAVVVVAGLLAIWLVLAHTVTPQAADLGLELEEVSILLVTNQRGIAPIAAYAVVSPEHAETLRGTSGTWGVLVDRKRDWR